MERYTQNPSAEAWQEFAKNYLALLEERFDEDQAPFADLATLAGPNDVYLGCWCPTKKNPDVSHCHTVLALGFMKKKFHSLS